MTSATRASGDRTVPKVHLVGGGDASMAAAAFMIRDGDIPGRQITIYEELDKIGGALDGSGSPENGYVLRGGRMFESQYRCTFELFSSIPTLDGRSNVTRRSFRERDDEDVVQMPPRPKWAEANRSIRL